MAKIRFPVPIIVFGFLLLYGATLSAIASDVVHLLLPKHRILASELAIIINDADPLSIRIGNYYRKARDIPARNILHVDFRPGRSGMGSAEFQRLRSRLDAQTPANVQAYAITWAAPYRVGCMSITSAFTFGFDKRYCSKQRCAPTRHSSYYMYPGASPYTDFGIRPTVAIAAENFRGARALIDRGVASDRTRPAGTAWLVSTSDSARNVRAPGYATVAKHMAGWIDTRIVESAGLENTGGILFYFTGKVSVPYLDTLQFVPGAIADHLTSAGGKLTGNNKQMSALRWLEAGATGSYGTVVEPCNLTGKFPNPGALMDVYGSGRTLLQAYWQSVQQPGEGIFIGEPLAAPFDGFTLKDQGKSILLTTRTLIPGHYRLIYSQGPVGPYRALPNVIEAGYHQREFTLPNAGAGYYRLEKI
ncbi:MAG: TIGR03790 family protein [Thermotogales bacterium]|nr:TIGR03790 family protein [Thermotogales bacterium]